MLTVVLFPFGTTGFNLIWLFLIWSNSIALVLVEESYRFETGIWGGGNKLREGGRPGGGGGKWRDNFSLFY